MCCVSLTVLRSRGRIRNATQRSNTAPPPVDISVRAHKKHHTDFEEVAKMRVTVEEYNPAWPEQFSGIRSRLEKALSSVTYRSIEHVGSTSVFGLAAKPVIDVDVVVKRDELDPVIKALEAAGYHCLGDKGIPDRYAFKPRDPNPSQNIYVCVEGTQALRNHLLVRDVCRASEKIRDLYGQRKLELSRQQWKDVDEYCAAKNDILAWVLSHGMTAAETDQIRSLNAT